MVFSVHIDLIRKIIKCVEHSEKVTLERDVIAPKYCFRWSSNSIQQGKVHPTIVGKRLEGSFDSNNHIIIFVSGVTTDVVVMIILIDENSVSNFGPVRNTCK